jgi:hypothetical protein
MVPPDVWAVGLTVLLTSAPGFDTTGLAVTQKLTENPRPVDIPNVMHTVFVITAPSAVMARTGPGAARSAARAAAAASEARRPAITVPTP